MFLLLKKIKNTESAHPLYRSTASSATNTVSAHLCGMQYAIQTCRLVKI